MRIGVNVTSLSPGNYETFLHLAKHQPGHTFLFFYDSESKDEGLPENIIPVGFFFRISVA